MTIHSIALAASFGLILAPHSPQPRRLSASASGRSYETPGAARRRIAASFAKLPLVFAANHGQSDPEVKFVSRGRGYTMFPSTETVLSTHNPKTPVRMKLLGANPAPQMEGLEKLPGASNYLVGNDRGKWRIQVPHYSRVRYRNVYPGVDLVY